MLFCDFLWLIILLDVFLTGNILCFLQSNDFPSGNMAEEKQTWHYRLKNDSFCLQICTNALCDDNIWTFNNTVIFRNKGVTHNFTGKVDYNPGNLSLCINKLTEADSGIYKVISFIPGNTMLTESHILLVQGTSFH